MDVILSLCQTLVKHAFLCGFVFESKAYLKAKRIQQQSVSNSKAYPTAKHLTASKQDLKKKRYNIYKMSSLNETPLPNVNILRKKQKTR